MNGPEASNGETRLRWCARVWLALVAASVLLTCRLAPAQDLSAESQPPVSVPADEVPAAVTQAADRIQYVGPDTYILLDAEGRPQPVPGMTYEDFLAAWKKTQQNARPAGAARYSIENVALSGSTKRNYAELDFIATVRLLSDGDIEVPLGLVGALLRGEPKFGRAENGTSANSSPPDVPANGHLTHDAEHGGFVARFAGKSGERRRISLSLIVPLARDGNETTLQLSCPKALASELTLNTSGAVAQVSVTNGTLVEQEPGETNSGTRLRVAGPAGPVRLTWQSGDEGSAEFGTVLSAAGAIRVSIDGRSVRSDAALTVQSFGRGFDRFRVRLPAGAQLIPGRAAEGSAESADYRITMENSTDATGTDELADSRSVALVEFVQEQQAPVTIQLSTEQPIGLESGAPLELAGFEVLGAVRQYGDISLEVADDWQARWEIGRNVRQVDVSELAAGLQRAGHTAAFQYDAQPWSLGVRVAARQSRVHVTPRYEIQFLPDEARLTLRLSYQVSGSRVFELRVRSEGWELVNGSLESAGLVDQDRVFSEDGAILMPLAQAATPRAEVSMTLRRALSEEQTRLELPLPVPIANTVGTGDVVLRSGNGFELRADLQNSTGLSAAPVSDAAEERDSGSGNELRLRSMLTEPVIVVDRVHRAREVAVKAANTIEIGAAEATVEQELTYDVQFEPLEELLLEAPAELPFAESALEMVLRPAAREGESDDDTAGTPLKPADSSDETVSSEDLAANQLRIALPTPQLGTFRVIVSSRVPRPENFAANEWDLPLVRPAEGRIAGWNAEVRGPRTSAIGLNAKSTDSSWKSVTPRNGMGDVRATYEFSATKAETVLPLMLSPVEFNPTTATTIDRVWLQSWISGNVRQDRAAIRFRTAGSRATIELSPQTPADEVEVLVDGKPAENLSQAAGRIVVRVEQRVGNDEMVPVNETAHTLELRSREQIQEALLTRHRLTPPQVLGTKSLSQVYWQIVLPGDVHVVRSPPRMTPAGEWQWLGSFWGRRPQLVQAELEEWAGASSQIAPAAEHNQYLYTGISPAVSIELITAPRWLIVLVSSSVVLAAVLLWIYVPAARSRWVVAGLACVLASLAVAFPVPAILLAQASVLGVIVAILAMVLTRLLARPALVPISISIGSSRYSPRAESILMPPVVATASTAPTVPLRVPEGER